MSKVGDVDGKTDRNRRRKKWFECVKGDMKDLRLCVNEKSSIVVKR